MKTFLYLRADGLLTLDGQWQCWCWSLGQPVRMASLVAHGQQLKGLAVHVILPAELASYHLTTPWSQRRKPSLQAIGYAIEDELAEDLDALQLFVGTPDRQRRYPVWAVQRERYEAVRALLDQCTILPAAIHIDADLLPLQGPGGAWLGGRWLLGGTLPFRLAADESNLDVLRGRLPAAMQWLSEPGDSAGTRKPSPDMDPRLLEHAIAAAVDWMPPVSLLQGLPWRWMATSALAAGVLAFAFVWARTEFLLEQSAQLRADNLQRGQALWPGVGKQAVEEGLRSMGVPSSAEPAPASELTRLADAVLSGGGIQALRVRWRTGEGWALDVRADHLGDLERLAERREQGAVVLSIGSTEQTDQQISATLQWPGDER